MEANALAKVQENYTHCDRDELKKKLEENREQHIKDYEKAITGWRVEFAKVILEHAEACKALADKVASISPENIDFEYPALPQKPENHTKDYDRIIARLGMEQETRVYLSHADFNRYVLDEWRWKDAFTETLSNYV